MFKKNYNETTGSISVGKEMNADLDIWKNSSAKISVTRKDLESFCDNNKI